MQSWSLKIMLENLVQDGRQNNLICLLVPPNSYSNEIQIVKICNSEEYSIHNRNGSETYKQN